MFPAKLTPEAFAIVRKADCCQFWKSVPPDHCCEPVVAANVAFPGERLTFVAV